MHQGKLTDYSDYDEVIEYIATTSGAAKSELEVYEIRAGTRVHVFIVGRKDKHWVGIRSLKVES